jgi:hypothetical protein
MSAEGTQRRPSLEGCGGAVHPTSTLVPRSAIMADDHTVRVTANAGGAAPDGARKSAVGPASVTWSARSVDGGDGAELIGSFAAPPAAAATEPGASAATSVTPAKVLIRSALPLLAYDELEFVRELGARGARRAELAPRP